MVKLFLGVFVGTFGLMMAGVLATMDRAPEADFCKEIAVYEEADGQLQSLKHTADAVAIEKRRQDSGRRVASMAYADIVAHRPLKWCGLEKAPDEATLIEIAVGFIQQFGLEKGSPDWGALTAAYNRVRNRKIV